MRAMDHPDYRYSPWPSGTAASGERAGEGAMRAESVEA
jgi:hypothetical protein